MRKIHQEMYSAVVSREDLYKSNVAVVQHDDGTATVKLYGNVIANVDENTNITPVIETVKAFPTNTTLNALRALYINIKKVKGEILLNGEPI